MNLWRLTRQKWKDIKALPFYLTARTENQSWWDITGRWPCNDWWGRSRRKVRNCMFFMTARRENRSWWDITSRWPCNDWRGRSGRKSRQRTKADETSWVNEPAMTDEAAVEGNRGTTLLLWLNLFTAPPVKRDLGWALPSLDVFIVRLAVMKWFHNKKWKECNNMRSRKVLGVKWTQSCLYLNIICWDRSTGISTTVQQERYSPVLSELYTKNREREDKYRHIGR